MTYQYLLSFLPEHIAYKAAAYAARNPQPGRTSALLDNAFSWSRTDEGSNYWCAVAQALRCMSYAAPRTMDGVFTDPLPQRTVVQCTNEDWSWSPPAEALSLNDLLRAHLRGTRPTSRDAYYEDDTIRYTLIDERDGGRSAQPEEVA